MISMRHKLKLNLLCWCLLVVLEKTAIAQHPPIQSTTAAEQHRRGLSTAESDSRAAYCHGAPSTWHGEDAEKATPINEPCYNVNAPGPNCPRATWLEDGHYKFWGQENPAEITKACGRRILLDLGTNRWDTSLEWFASTYPVPFDEIHGWEMNSKRLWPQVPFPGKFKAQHNKSLPNAVTLFNAAADTKTSDCGNRHRFDLAHKTSGCFAEAGVDDEACQRQRVQLKQYGLCASINVVDYLKAIAKPEDFVVFKMDVEGMEFKILDQLWEANAFELIDEMCVEFHFRTAWAPGWTKPGGQATLSYPGRVMELKDATDRVEQWRRKVRAFHIWA